jgi:serine protease
VTTHYGGAAADRAVSNPRRATERMQFPSFRAALLPVVLVVGAVAAAACRPPPPPPPVHTLCAAAATPGPGAQVALVAQGGTRPAVVKFQASSPTEIWTKVAQLNQTGQVLAVGPDQPVHAQTVTPTNNPAYTPNQQDFQASEVDFPAAWNAIPSEDGTGVRVAVVDTGVQADHPDLAGNVTAGNDLVFGNGASNFARVDGNGHGTHVAGTIAAVDNTIGVIGGAPHSTIVPVRVLDCQGSGSTSTVAAGIEWASDPAGGNVKVISMSLGGPGPDPVLQNAIQDALNRQVLVVSAAGNCGPPSGCSDGPGNTPEFPGAYADVSYLAFHNHGVIAVGALDGTNPANIVRASFSNSNAYVTVAAPGVNIASTLPFGGTPHSNPSGYGFLSGTSMATPHVSAVAALIYQRCPTDTPAQVEARIVTGAQALASPTGPNGFISGTVGMLRADAVVSGISCP